MKKKIAIGALVCLGGFAANIQPANAALIKGTAEVETFQGRTFDNVSYNFPVKHFNVQHYNCHGPSAQLPSKVDPRGTFFSTPVHNQGKVGLCWAYSGTDGLAVAKLHATGIQETYSPNYYNYLFSADAFRTNVKREGDYIYNPTSLAGSLRGLGGGGNSNSLAVAAMEGYAPVTESAFPTWTTEGVGDIRLSTVSVNPADLSQLGKDADSYEVTDLNIFDIVDQANPNPTTRINQLKKAILHTGSVYYSYNGYLTQKLNYESNVYNQETSALYLPVDYPLSSMVGVTPSGNEGPKTNPFLTNHAVLIVGYDDNYAKENFHSDNQPVGNGAFLVKNSWGTDFGEGGYFWVSYYDYQILENPELSSIQYNPAVQSKDQQVHTNSTIAPMFDLDNLPHSVLAENYEAADKDQVITGITVPSVGDHTHYVAYLSKKAFDPQEFTTLASFKTSSDLHRVAQGHFATGGQHKVRIPNICLKKGEKVSLIVIEDASKDTTYTSIPLCGDISDRYHTASAATTAGDTFYGDIAGQDISYQDLQKDYSEGENSQGLVLTTTLGYISR